MDAVKETKRWFSKDSRTILDPDDQAHNQYGAFKDAPTDHKSLRA